MRMLGVFVLVMSIFVLGVLLSVLSPWTGQLLVFLAYGVLGGLVAAGVGLAVAFILAQRRGANLALPLRRNGDEGRGFGHPRILLVTALTLAAGSCLMVLLVQAVPSLRIVVVRGVYFLVLIGSGIALGAYGRAKVYVPVVVAALLLAVIGGTHFYLFVNDPAAVTHYGPERVWYALARFTQQVALFFPDAGVLTAVWAISKSAWRPGEAGETP
jgi:hypothetical protein